MGRKRIIPKFNLDQIGPEITGRNAGNIFQQPKTKKARSVIHLQNINVKDNWETPVFEKMGGKTLQEWQDHLNIHPLLDVCATAANRKCEQYFNKKQDGLKQEWTKDFFGNFPYSNVKTWMKKAYLQHVKYNVNAMILIYSKTDTAFWHDYVENKSEVHFIRGRVRFLIDGKRPVTINKQGKEVKLAAPYPSCFVIYRKKSKYTNQYGTPKAWDIIHKTRNRMNWKPHNPDLYKGPGQWSRTFSG